MTDAALATVNTNSPTTQPFASSKAAGVIKTPIATGGSTSLPANKDGESKTKRGRSGEDQLIIEGITGELRIQLSTYAMIRGYRNPEDYAADIVRSAIQADRDLCEGAFSTRDTRQKPAK